MSRLLVDTNILLRIVETTSPLHEAAVEATDFLWQQGDTLCLVPQNIYEFWATATRPAGVNGLGMTHQAAESHVADFLQLFVFLRDERTIFRHWHQLVNQHQVYGLQAHDARLAAAMKRHDIKRVLTFDLNIFRRFDGIEVLDPAEVIA